MTTSENESMAVQLLYITVPDKACGLSIGRALVERQLIACANVIDGATSVFKWNDEVQEEGEAILIAKTRAELLDAVTQTVNTLHPYDCPCVVAVDIVGGNVPFLNWIETETTFEA